MQYIDNYPNNKNQQHQPQQQRQTRYKMRINQNDENFNNKQDYTIAMKTKNRHQAQDINIDMKGITSAASSYDTQSNIQLVEDTLSSDDDYNNNNHNNNNNNNNKTPNDRISFENAPSNTNTATNPYNPDGNINIANNLRKHTQTHTMSTNNINNYNGNKDTISKSNGGAPSSSARSTVILSSRNQSNIDWPFGQHSNKFKRTFQSKGIESVILSIILLIYIFPLFFDDPQPNKHPNGYQLWFAHLFGLFIPYFILFLIRLIELWNIKFFDRRYNENNFYLGRFFFYLIFFLYCIGLLAVTIEFDDTIEYVRNNSIFLFVSCLISSIIFGILIVFAIGYILLMCIAIFCCQITRNRWEMRVVWKVCCLCCKLGELNPDGHRTQRIPFQAR